MSERYLNYINNFRGFVIVLIVAIHCVSSQLLQWSSQSDLRYFLHSVLHGASIFYVFIAGFLFKILIEKFTYIKYLKRKFLFVFLPYLIVSIPAIWDEVRAPKAIYENFEIWMQICVYYITGVHMAHFWFIPMIVIYYLISPIFVWVDKNNIYLIVVPFFLFVAVFVPREIYPTHNPFVSGLHFIGFYLLGMWAASKIYLIQRAGNYYLLGIVISVFIVLLSWFLHINQGESTIGSKFIYVVKFGVMCLTLTVLFKRFDEKIGGAFGYLANQSFGIYFIHNYFIVLFEKIFYRFSVQMEGGVITLAIIIAVVTLCSIGLVGIVKFLSKSRSKYIIGC